MAIKGELFSTDMVKAFLEGRKSRTSRPVKRKGYDDAINDPINDFAQKFGENLWEIGQRWENRIAPQRSVGVSPKYQPGNIMYCRETWRIQSAHRYEMDTKIEFKAGGPMSKIQFSNRDDYDAFIGKWWNEGGKWHPSIFMPREAGRLFFRVTDVKVQNIADMTEQDAEQDGFVDEYVEELQRHYYAVTKFKCFWLNQYGPDARWMWAYYLKKISKEEALKDV